MDTQTLHVTVTHEITVPQTYTRNEDEDALLRDVRAGLHDAQILGARPLADALDAGNVRVEILTPAETLTAAERAEARAVHGTRS